MTHLGTIGQGFETPDLTSPPQVGERPATLEEVLDHQNRQSELLLAMAQMLSDVANRAEPDVAPPSPSVTPAALQEVMARLDRIEKTLQVTTRHAAGTQARRIRCLFLIHHPTAWPAMREIVDVMRTCEDFEPVVMSLPHRFPLLQQMAGEDEVHTMLAAQGYPHIRIRDAAAETALDQVRALAPAVIFRQAPWDHDLPACLSAERLAFSRLCYVPYGYLTARIESHQFDQLLHRLAWRIFCPDDVHRELFMTHNLLTGLNCRVTGYPKFDHLARHIGTEGTWPIDTPATERRFRLLWAPHFAYQGDWLKFGVFDAIAEDMLTLASHNPGLEIVMRPHPALREAMQAAPTGSALWNFTMRWQALDNTGFSTEQEYADLFAASDAMVTDGLSFFSEYQLFDKPLVFFERHDHAGFNLAGEKLLPGMHRIHTMDELTHLLGELVQGQEPSEVATARRQIASALRPFPGDAARRIVESIRHEWTMA